MSMSITTHTTTPKQPHKQQHNRKSNTTLASYLKYFIDYSLQVELKTGYTITGTLQHADACMNLILADTTRTSDNHNDHKCDNYTLVHISGTSIRYIHFPSNLNLASVIKEGAQQEQAAKARYSRRKRQKR